jgi:integrase
MPRKGENIYLRKDGRWEGRYLKKYTQGGSRYGYVYGKTYIEVKNRVSEIKTELEGKNVKSDDILENIAKDWLESSGMLFRESTVIKYKNLLRLYILPHMGEYSISQITNETIHIFTNSLLDTGGENGTGLSPKTVRDSVSLLKSIQRYAADKDMKVNFISYRFPMRQEKQSIRVFSIQEEQILYTYLKSNMTPRNLGILVSLFTGVRIGELCALKWGDISFSEKTLYVHQTMQRIHEEKPEVPYSPRTKIIVTEPKSAASVRSIPLLDILVCELFQQRQSPDCYVLTGKEEKFIEPRTMQNHFKSILKACGIKDTNFHTLRHTFATRCVEVGFDIKSLSEVLGHANVNITLNRYVHPSFDSKMENMSKLSDLFFNE